MANQKKVNYVCDGAKLKCTFGDKESTLKVRGIPFLFAYIDGKAQATIYDCVPNMNIFPFGRCGPRKTTCIPAPSSEIWLLGSETETVDGMKALLKTSVLICKFGGYIEIVDPACEITTGAVGLLSTAKNQEKEKKEKDKKLKAAEEKREANNAKAKQADKKKSGEGKEKKEDKNNEDDIRKKIVEAAKSLEGSEYVSGGIVKGGIDCSGTVYYSNTQAGVNIGDRTDAQGYHNKMVKIDRSQLKPGDIITYYSKNKGRIYHVQIYLGTAKTSGLKGRPKILVDDAVLNASPSNGIYITSLKNHLTYGLEKNDVITVYYGNLLQ